MQAEAAIPYRIILESETFEVHFFARDDVLVVGFSVGKLGFVEVVAGLGENDPFLPDVDADAIDGGKVLAEELFLLKGGTVDDVKVHFHTLELELVAQCDVVDELAGLVFDHIDGLGRLENAEVAVPHCVVGVDALHGLVDEGRVAHLNEEKVLARVVLVIQGCAYLVAAYGVPKLRAIVYVDGVGVVFPAANGHDLLSCRKEEVVGEVPIEIGPVGALEEGVGEADVGCIDALAQVIAELAAEGAVQGHHEIFACKTMVGAWGDCIIPRMVVEGEVSTGVQVQVVQGDKGFAVL